MVGKVEFKPATKQIKVKKAMDYNPYGYKNPADKAKKLEELEKEEDRAQIFKQFGMKITLEGKITEEIDWLQRRIAKLERVLEVLREED